MKTFETNGMKRIILMELTENDLLLESIQKTIDEYQIKNGIVLSGIGTLKKAKMHYIDSFEPTPENVYVQDEEPFELCSIDGLIVDGVPHLHFVNASKNEINYIGHLEDDCVVLYLAEIAIGELDCDDVITRKPTENGVVLMTDKE